MALYNHTTLVSKFLTNQREFETYRSIQRVKSFFVLYVLTLSSEMVEIQWRLMVRHYPSQPSLQLRDATPPSPWTNHFIPNLALLRVALLFLKKSSLVSAFTGWAPGSAVVVSTLVHSYPFHSQHSVPAADTRTDQPILLGKALLQHQQAGTHCAPIDQVSLISYVFKVFSPPRRQNPRTCFRFWT